MKTTAEIVPLRKGSENLHRFSRFAWQDVYIRDGRKFWGTWEPVSIPQSASDRYVTVTDATAGRLDLLSYEAYGTPELWWVIAEANLIFFPPEQLVSGSTIRVPSATTVATLGLMR